MKTFCLLASQWAGVVWPRIGRVDQLSRKYSRTTIPTASCRSFFHLLPPFYRARHRHRQPGPQGPQDRFSPVRRAVLRLRLSGASVTAAGFRVAILPLDAWKARVRRRRGRCRGVGDEVAGGRCRMV